MSQPSPSSSPEVVTPPAMMQVPAAQFQQMSSALQHLLNQQQQQAAAAAAAARIRLPKLPPPTKFRGESGFRVDAWIRELQRQFDYYDTEFPSDKERVKFAAAFMEDLAAQWWLDAAPTLREQHREAIPWSAFVEALHARFRPLESALVARQQLEQLQQGSQSVDQYAHRFQAILTSIKDMSEADKVYRFVVNLRNALKQKVLQEGHKTLREAIQSAASHEAAYRFSRPHPAQSYQRFVPHTRSDASGSVPMDINNVESECKEEDDESFVGEGGSTPSAISIPESALSALAAKLTAHVDQRINAIVQQRRGPPPPRRSNDLVPGLTPEELERCLRNRLCLRCKQPGHMKSECPQRNAPRAPRRGN